MHVATHAVMRSAPWSSYRRPVSPYTFQSVLLLSPVPWRPLICCPLIQFCLFQTVMQMEPYSTQLFESAFFCSALCFWFRSMLLHVSEVCSFLLLHTIPSSGYDLFFFLLWLYFLYLCPSLHRVLFETRDGALFIFMNFSLDTAPGHSSVSFQHLSEEVKGPGEWHVVPSGVK